MDNTSSFAWMAIMALTFGVKHGFDVDHLATIDAITRTVRHQQKVSNLVGFFFSLGHGLVVTSLSMIIGSGLLRSHVPEWLEGFGMAISIFFLFLFGFLNLWNLYHNPAQTVLPVGIRSFLARRLVRSDYGPAMIAAIGALFALSFDTISQIALFSLSASFIGGWVYSGLLGFCFTIGMILSDGLNGLLVSLLIQRADRVSILFSRGLGVAVSAFSLTTGCIGLWKTFQQ